MNMKSRWMFLYAVCAWLPVRATLRSSTSCHCHGKAQFCRADRLGLLCVNCQENSEGRHCESCKEGFYHQRAEESCAPCNCNATGSQGPVCNSAGQCVCKPGVHGNRCDLCPDGSAITVNGCQYLRPSCRSRSTGQLTVNPAECAACFCRGHSASCTPADGYSVHNITSTFDNGHEGWRAATAHSVSPSHLRFRMTTTHKVLEVVSAEVLPVYFIAPESYLGNQILSYDQTLSFALRLDHGVRRPSSADVVLEGAGLKVSASLGDLRSVVQCGKKITYTFRLNEQPSSKWKPQLSSSQFQTLLSNLTAIKIRGTFGENGRGYLDDVTLVSAKLGSGVPAVWAMQCRCPAGYDGLFCERCGSGHRRRFPGQGPGSPCDPCSCQDRACDPETGRCSPAETQDLQMCPRGFYMNRHQPGSCRKCPCLEGKDCHVIPGTQEVICTQCPKRTTGLSCEFCDVGFYGDPLGRHGQPKQCQPCQCTSLANCDRRTGQCRKCSNHSSGFMCENCEEGYYHSHQFDPCQVCDCSRDGSVSISCNNQGQCVCKDGHEGLKCEKSTCPSCFNTVKRKIDDYEQQLLQMQELFKGIGDGDAPMDGGHLEQALMAAEVMVKTLENRANQLTNFEKELQGKVASISQTQLLEDKNMDSLIKTVNEIKSKGQLYKNNASEMNNLISDIKLKLEQAQRDIHQAGIPSVDSISSAESWSGLVQKAADLAEQHQSEVSVLESIASSSLSESGKALRLLHLAIEQEKKVMDEVDDLQKLFEADAAKVRELEKDAVQVMEAASKESRLAQNSLEQLSSLEENPPKPLKREISAVISRLDMLEEKMDDSSSQYQDLKTDILNDKTETKHLLSKANSLQQIEDQLLARVNAAEAVKNNALEIFFNNSNELEKMVDSFTGFEEWISANKSWSDAAIGTLPAINATIQNVLANNTRTKEILLASAAPYMDAQKNLDTLKSTVDKLQQMSGSIPSSDVLQRAFKLNKELNGLRSEVSATKDRLNEEITKTGAQTTAAQQAVKESTAALSNAINARQAVNDTLHTIDDIVNALGSDSPTTVDENRVSDLERALAKSRDRVEKELRPRLKELAKKEAQQRAHIASLISEIDSVLVDIANLEEIHETIPDGCYNIPLLERP